MRLKTELLIPFVIIMIMLTGQGLAIVPKAEPTFAVRVLPAVKQGEIGIDFRIFGGSFSGKYFVSGFATNTSTSEMPVYFFYDNQYPSSQVASTQWQGIFDHLSTGLLARGYQYSAEEVNADALPQVMSQRSIVVLPAGEIPITIARLGVGHIRNFMLAGGIIIWAGDVFGGYVGLPNKTLTISVPTLTNFLQAASVIEQQILGFNYSYSTAITVQISAMTMHQSPTFNALQLGYTTTNLGVPLGILTEHNGTLLGVYSDFRGLTSIAFVRVGSGGIVIFGGGTAKSFQLNSEIVMGDDMARIICSGILPSFSLAFSKSIWVPAHVDVSTEESVALDGQRLILVAFSDQFSQFLYDVQTIQISRV
jgi:hypothetical protein